MGQAVIIILSSIFLSCSCFVTYFIACSSYSNVIAAHDLPLKGGPKPLGKESQQFLGSKRDDRFSNPFFEMVPKTCQGSFFVPASE